MEDGAFNNVIPLGNSVPGDSRVTPVSSKGLVPAAPAQTAVGERTQFDATPEEIEGILKRAEHLMTHSGGPIYASDAQRECAAYLKFGSRGIFIIDKMDALNASAISLRDTIKRAKNPITHEIRVSKDVIRDLYRLKQSTAVSVSTVIGVEAAQKRVFEIFEKAAKARASDIFITLEDTSDSSDAEVRIRVDGTAVRLGMISGRDALTLFQATFTLTDSSDTSYKPTEYQGARISRQTQPNLPKDVCSIRLQWNPTANQGRMMNARLLYDSDDENAGDVDTLGYNAQQVADIRALRERPNGAIIISGQTGSGKSTTLARCLNAYLKEINYEKILGTIEDPPEFTIKSAIQIPVQNAADEEEKERKFASALYALLRSNPDHIMIGEIRGKGTGRIAMRAAIDGHLVWSTMHSNTAVTIPVGLHERGVEDIYIYDPTILIGLIGQRLVKKLCPHCKMTYSNFEKTRSKLVDESIFSTLRTIYGAKADELFFGNDGGCDECDHKGYRGRTVVAEIIRPDHRFYDLLRAGNKVEAVSHWQNELNGISMLDHGIQKMMLGEVDPREVQGKIAPLSGFDAGRINKVLKGL